MNIRSPFLLALVCNIEQTDFLSNRQWTLWLWTDNVAKDGRTKTFWSNETNCLRCGNWRIKVIKLYMEVKHKSTRMRKSSSLWLDELLNSMVGIIKNDDKILRQHNYTMPWPDNALLVNVCSFRSKALQDQYKAAGRARFTYNGDTNSVHLNWVQHIFS